MGGQKASRAGGERISMVRSKQRLLVTLILILVKKLDTVYDNKKKIEIARRQKGKKRGGVEK